MLFHSQVFVLLFLPATVLLYYRLAARPVAREWLLVAASLVFYGWWDARFLPLLLGQTMGTWLLVELYWRWPRRAVLLLGIVLNLTALGTFKYLDFLVDIAEDVSGITLPRAGLILPIGISFYTFQIVSYLVDVMHAKAPRYGLRRFAVFVTLFPQLIAGPIVRHNEILPQLDLDPLRPGVAERVSRGLTLFFIGFAEKVFIADKLAPISDAAYEAAATGIPAMSQAWAGMLAFTFQVFFDFLAYSDMALGIGLMLGLTLPENFHLPFRTTDLVQFWQRWHMTLSRFLRDYVFKPLHSRRRGWGPYVAALMITMLLCGLWHGAGWHYIVWGGLQGVGMVVVRMWRRSGGRMPIALAWFITQAYFSATAIFFRAADLDDAARMFQGLIGLGGLGAFWDARTFAAIAIAALFGMAVPVTGLALATERLQPRRWAAAALTVGVLACILEVGRGAPHSFIYFQF